MNRRSFFALVAAIAAVPKSLFGRAPVPVAAPSLALPGGVVARAAERIRACSLVVFTGDRDERGVPYVRPANGPTSVAGLVHADVDEGNYTSVLTSGLVRTSGPCETYAVVANGSRSSLRSGDAVTLWRKP